MRTQMSRSIKITYSLEIVCVISLTIFALFGLAIASIFIQFKIPIGYGENNVLVSAWGLLNGYGLYRKSAIDTIPAFMASYSPIYYLFVVLGFKLFGVSHFFGRLINLIAVLGSAALIGLIARRQKSERIGAIISAAAFLCVWPVMVFSRQSRVDNLAICFELAALFTILGNRSIAKNIFFIVFALCAGYTKQTAFGIVLAALISLYADNGKSDRKRAMILAAAYASSALIIFVILQLSTGGAFYFATVKNYTALIEWGVLLDNLRKVFGDPFDLAVIAAGLYIGIVSLKRGEKLPISLICVPLFLSLLAAGKPGSNINYFTEFLAGACINLGSLFRRLPDEIERKKYGISIAASLALILGVSGSIISRAEVFENWIMMCRNRAQYMAEQTSISVMKDVLPPGALVLAQYSEIPLFAGCTPVLSDPFKFNEMTKFGFWNPAPLVEAIVNRRIQLIIMQEKISADGSMQFLPAEAARAILENYIPIPSGNSQVFLYVPQKIE